MRPACVYRKRRRPALTARRRAGACHMRRARRRFDTCYAGRCRVTCRQSSCHSGMRRPWILRLHSQTSTTQEEEQRKEEDEDEDEEREEEEEGEEEEEEEEEEQEMRRTFNHNRDCWS